MKNIARRSSSRNARIHHWDGADEITRRMAATGLARLQQQLWRQEERLERLEESQGRSLIGKKGAGEHA